MGPVVICVASAVSVLLFLVCAWLTRASYWRVAAALMGGLLAAAGGFALDLAAFQFAWWSHGPTAAHAPIAAYAPVVFWFGGGLGLIGWRMMRNWGGAGEAAFFLVFVLLGLARDLVMAGSGSFTFGDGPWPILIDAGGWLAMAVLVQLVMQLLVGPVDIDDLAPERIPQLDDDFDPASA